MKINFNEKPFLVIWETTRACDLACVHCRASATAERAADELTPEEGRRLIESVAKLGTPLFIFSGGDPLKREDLEEFIAYAKSLKLRTGAIPAVTPNLTRERLMKLKESGLDQIAFSLDSADPVEHDQFRRVPGVFRKTLETISTARELGLRVQINSLINVHNTGSLKALIALVEGLPIVFWEVFFLVPTGRGKLLPVLTAPKFEQAFEMIYALSQRAPFVVKVTEGQHYRRFVYEKTRQPQAAAILHRGSGPEGGIGLAPQGVNAAKGFAFVASNGDVMPSGFLPIPAGNVRQQNFGAIYQASELFRNLRDVSLLKGRCGACSFRELCGGSRARAYALTGDYLAEDPCCAYQPV